MKKLLVIAMVLVFMAPVGIAGNISDGDPSSNLSFRDQLSVDSGNCITLGPDASGKAYEYCW